VEDRQHALIGRGLPMRVGTGHVAIQSSRGTGITIEQQRQMTRNGLTGCLREECGKAVPLNKIEQRGTIFDSKTGGNIHRGRITFDKDRADISSILSSLPMQEKRTGRIFAVCLDGS